MSDESQRPPSRVSATWRGDHQFDAGRPNGEMARIDGEGVSAQSPPDALLSALATCSGVDVVDILAKRRTPVEALVVEVVGHRRETMPRRFVRIELTYRVDGAGIEAVHAERSVRLAFEKYCSVSASLAPDIEIVATVVVNGAEGPAIRQPTFVPD